MHVSIKINCKAKINRTYVVFLSTFISFIKMFLWHNSSWHRMAFLVAALFSVSLHHTAFQRHELLLFGAKATACPWWWFSMENNVAIILHLPKTTLNHLSKVTIHKRVNQRKGSKAEWPKPLMNLWVEVNNPHYILYCDEWWVQWLAGKINFSTEDMWNAKSKSLPFSKWDFAVV